MAALNLHLRYDEIADLMQLCATGPSGQIAYDEFISLIDHNMRERREEVLGKVEEAFFEKLGQAMDHSKETLVDVMQSYDVNNDGTIDPRDLSKVINKLGIMNPDPHLEHVFRAGRSEEGERIVYVDFATNLETEIRRRKRTAAQDREKLLEAISTILKSQERSYFELFVILDVNKSGLVSRLEFLTGM
jgi:Ca2+-binding EF-hand superfamily protein